MGRTLFIYSFLSLQFYLLIVYILVQFNYECDVVPTSSFWHNWVLDLIMEQLIVVISDWLDDQMFILVID